MRKDDSDALSFLNTAGITNQVIFKALNNLVLDLKAADIWTRCTAIYPMVGASATTHSYNLKNPAQYQLTFAGGWSHSSTGALPNGTNAYADTGINGSTVLTQSSNHLSFYSRSNTAAGTKASMGAYNNTASPNEILSLTLKNTTGNTGAFNTSQATGQFAAGLNADSRGFYILNKTGSGIGGLNIIKNGTIVAQNTVAITTNTYANKNVYIGASSVTTGTAFQYDDKECAFSSIGTRLASYQYPFYTSIITNFQTALSRNV